MKQEDTELIITNEIEDTAAEAPKSEKLEGLHIEIIKNDAAEEPTPVVEKEPEQSFVEALHEQIHEEDAPSQKINLVKILGGDFFKSQILRKNIGLMILIVGFVIVYISNRYSCQKSMLEIDKLKQELQDAKYKALSTSSRLTEQSRQSNVLDMLKYNKDSVLHIANQPPFIIQVPEQ